MAGVELVVDDVTDAQVTAVMQIFNLAALRGLQSRTVGVRASRYEVERAETDPDQLARMSAKLVSMSNPCYESGRSLMLFDGAVRSSGSSSSGRSSKIDSPLEATLRPRRPERA